MVEVIDSNQVLLELANVENSIIDIDLEIAKFNFIKLDLEKKHLKLRQSIYNQVERVKNASSVSLKFGKRTLNVTRNSYREYIVKECGKKIQTDKSYRSINEICFDIVIGTL